MKNKISVSFNYGGWTLSFTKVYELPFIPFIGMSIQEDNDLVIDFSNNDYCSTSIYYKPKIKAFSINIRNTWRLPVRPDVIESVIKEYVIAGYKRTDSTNINDLNELMERDHKRKFSMI